MIKLSNNVVLCETAGDLPCLPSRIHELFMDFETSSRHYEIKSLNPWKVENCRLHLAAFTWDDNPTVYCVPRHLANVLGDLFKRSDIWINQNVKYDVHVAYNDGGFDFHGELHDTLTLAKLVDSDRLYRGGYGLDALAKAYCDIDLSPYYTMIKRWLVGTEDYGAIPIDDLADYAGNQVRANRVLHRKLLNELPDETRPVWETEKKLTQTLIKIERRGMVVDVMGVQKARIRAVKRMMTCQEKLVELLPNEYKDFNPDSNPDCMDLLINYFQLPKIYKKNKDGTQSKNPSFAKKVLKEYLRHPHSPIDVLKLIQEYRHESTMCGLFWEPWLQLHVDGVLHSSYNQVVRSGRTSCSMPNSQQFNDEARDLILPREGMALVCKDYKQIEYRIIVHYTNNKSIVQTYNENPDADFHQMMADEVNALLNGLFNFKRKPAKILNLALGYQMGKKSTIDSLRIDSDIIAGTNGDPALATEIATKAYHAFHRRLPEVKKHAEMAEGVARRRGYVRNAYGRRCHLPLEYCRPAFNRVCQSHAADLMKERTNALSDALDGLDYEAHLLASVHDETLSEVEADRAYEYADFAQNILNDVSVPLRVPIRCSAGVSVKSWLDAKEAGDRPSPMPSKAG